jgi:hypothetical protein
MKRLSLKGWALGLAAYLIFLIAALPATYVSGWAGKHLPSVLLSDVSGSVFSGRAATVSIGQSDLGAMEWSFDWLAPFTLTVGYRFHLHDAARDLVGRLDAGFGSLHLRDLKGHVPVRSFDAWSPLPSRSLSGNLVLDLKQVQLKAGRLQSATGDVELDDGSMSWPTPYTLGSYRMSLAPATAGGITGEISDVASPLKLHADLSLGPDGRYKLKGILAARDPGDATTRTMLSNLGRPDSTGQYPFDFNGQW